MVLFGLIDIQKMKSTGQRNIDSNSKYFFQTNVAETEF